MLIECFEFFFKNSEICTELNIDERIQFFFITTPYKKIEIFHNCTITNSFKTFLLWQNFLVSFHILKEYYKIYILLFK
jgi:hypothetical protein